MTSLAAILCVLSVCLLLICRGGLKDWHESSRWDRIRIVTPGIVGVAILLVVLSNSFSGFWNGAADPRHPVSHQTDTGKIPG